MIIFLLFFLLCSDDEFHVGCDWTRAVFSNSGEYIAVGSADGTVFIFNVASNTVEKRLKEHRYESIHGYFYCYYNKSNILFVIGNDAVLR